VIAAVGPESLNASALLRLFVETAKEQQRAIAALERDTATASTTMLEEIVPALQRAPGELDPRAVREALAIVRTSLALLKSLGEAREKITRTLQELGVTTGIGLDMDL
jgi:hypothetical protein